MSKADPGWLVMVFLISSLVASLGGSGCSSAGSSSTPIPPPPVAAANVQPISVTTGPAVSAGSVSVNTAFTTVTICVPGSTTQCQMIDGILVDTGSTGLRVLASVLTLSLPQQKDGSGNPVVECAQFADGQTWGPVEMADIAVAGEKASSVAIQVIGSPSFPTVPRSCSSLGPIEDDLASLVANGILGVGNFLQDCGPGCTETGAANLGFYYTCPSSGCQVTPQSLANQVSNPVAMFAVDNNGVLIELPAVSGPETTLTGSLIFGIGTQSNNALGSARVYTVDPVLGNFTTTFNGRTYTDASFLDSGSNAVYFLDSATTGMPTCMDMTFLYCPPSTQNFSATNMGANGTTGTVNFSVENGDTLTANRSNSALPNLAGPNTGSFDFGLPFFFGRNVFTAIEGKSTSGGTGPYVAY